MTDNATHDWVCPVPHCEGLPVIDTTAYWDADLGEFKASDLQYTPRDIHCCECGSVCEQVKRPAPAAKGVLPLYSVPVDVRCTDLWEGSIEVRATNASHALHKVREAYETNMAPGEIDGFVDMHLHKECESLEQEINGVDDDAEATFIPE